MARLYVYRLGGLVGRAVGWPVFVNGELLTKLRHSNYVLLEVPQGTLVLSSQCNGCSAPMTLHMPGIDVKAGQTYYVALSIHLGGSSSDGFMRLVDETTGAKEIRGSKPASDVRRLDDLSLMDQAQLARLALEAPDLSVRVDAFKRLAGRTQLATLALEEKDEHVRAWGAAQSRADQALLAKLASESKDSVVRVGAVDRLKDQALLAKLLAKVAMERTDPSVRLSAVERLKDQALLVKVAMESTEAVVRVSAVGEMWDQTLLAKLALENDENVVRVAAAKRINDEMLLGRLVREGTDAEVRAIASQILAGQALMARLMTEHNGAAVQVVIMNYLVTTYSGSNSDWHVSKSGTTLEIQKADPKQGAVTVEGDVMLQGGETWMQTRQTLTFFLVVEAGTLKLSGTKPSPKLSIPAVKPL